MSLVHIQAHLLDLSGKGFSVLPRLKNGHMDVMDILLLPRIVVTQFLLDGISSQTMNSRPITKENLKYQKEIENCLLFETESGEGSSVDP